ncbi:esterase [Ginsengibacter hankyongi]|uniref:Esterase n=1 Tax=Ginsengibacter hankyongi TaxID=2607284 RepID=A0A5J5IDG0_9BACT|nr:SGNH/GDSL hydrolase family protein [Ginsengibacter hankyongi]KAA9036560.1 esterase [Ginsengibacter hankyongi]
MFYYRNIKSVLIFIGILMITCCKKTYAQQSAQPIVINAGIGGNNTKDLLERIDKDCLAYKPDLTVLMVGTNDMNSMKYIPIEQYEKNLRRIINLILKSKSQVLVMNILPNYEPYLLTRHPRKFYGEEGPSGRMAEVNAVIKKVAAEKKVYFLDMHHIFNKVGNIGLDKSSLIQNQANSNNTDGLHPTPEGYRVMGIVVYEYIMNKKLPHHKVVCFGDSITYGDGSMDKESYPAYLKKLLSE